MRQCYLANKPTHSCHISKANHASEWLAKAFSISDAIHSPYNKLAHECFARLSSSITPNLQFVTPSHVSYIQVTINYSRNHDMQIRIQSSGHDYESLSFVSQVPFVIINLINLRSIDVDGGFKLVPLQVNYITELQRKDNSCLPSWYWPHCGCW